MVIASIPVLNGRARRRRARSGKKLLEHRDGWSTDEELTYSEENKFKNEKGEYLGCLCDGQVTGAA